VIRGRPRNGALALAAVDAQRRQDIKRNHTATHLLHAGLRRVLGDHARQAGSLVAPDRLRFDFTHTEALTKREIQEIEAFVNREILADDRLQIVFKPLQTAIAEGAIALFGEKYSETVRTITIGEPEPFSYELCGGTHLESTGNIGVFLITSEGSVGASVRRIEAVTGRGAYALIRERFASLNRTADLLATTLEQVPEKIAALQSELSSARKEINQQGRELTTYVFENQLSKAPRSHGVPVLAMVLPTNDAETIRLIADRFRQRCPSGVAVLAGVKNNRPILIAAVTDDLVQRGLHAGDLVKSISRLLGGSGGGRPTLAQAGGTDASKLDEAMAAVLPWVEQKLQPER
jgi:alanyl-tRNA synthetase